MNAKVPYSGSTLGAMSKDKAELVKMLREQQARGRGGANHLAGAAGDRAGYMPTSWAQQRLWFIDQLERGSAGYYVPIARRLSGPLDVRSLRDALNALVSRHEVLRTTFHNVGGVPKQKIAPAAEFSLREVDLSLCAQEELDARVRDCKDDELLNPFDLETGPLIRGKLLRLAAEEHILIITMHHIISDGWSISVLEREVSHMYNACRANRANGLPSLPLQYADYVTWQNAWLQGKRLEKQQSYWLQNLGGVLAQLDLPTDKPRPAMQSHRGANEELIIESNLWSKIRQFAKRHEVTPFMVLLGAWSVLMYRLTGNQDIVIGTPVANRQRPEFEGLIGFFVNTLALRVKTAPGMTASEFMAAVKEATLGAYANQDLPFERIVEAVQPERDVGRNPLFQVMFALNNVPRSAFTLDDVETAIESGVDDPAIFDVSVFLEDRGDTVRGVINYAADLFEQDTIQRWRLFYGNVLSELIQDELVALGRAEIVPLEERMLVTRSVNDTARSYSNRKLVHEMLEEAGTTRSEEIAVVHRDGVTTYGELYEHAASVAVTLREEYGVSRGDLVALCVERSVGMVVGMLGIMKAGGAYVPMDPHYPAARLKYFIEDCNPTAIVCDSECQAQLRQLGVRIPMIDVADAVLRREGVSGRRHSEVFAESPDQLAYVIYTSGSTGRPKGVMIKHGAVVNFLEAMRDIVQIEPDDRLLAVTTVAFDIAGLEIYLPLLCGARVVIADRETSTDPALLAKAIEKHGISALQATPATWRMLIDSGWNGCARLKALCGGEALPEELAVRVDDLVGVLWNLYGPTETTIWSAVHRHVAETDSGRAATPIGRPVANTRMYVLDDLRQPVPIGVAGELYIAGAGLALGYLSQPAATAERFVQVSVEGTAERMYRTGDRVRLLKSGEFEFIGRIDRQVKIRGYRIEPEEVESRLLEHPGLKEAAVLPDGDLAGSTRLIAYVVPRRQTDSEREVVELRKAVIEDWEAIWRDTYSGSEVPEAPSFVGWKSSYTGEMIPEDEMRCWLREAIERVKLVNPNKVLDIGCGIGLLLQGLAPGCSRYIGTDVSRAALEKVRAWAHDRPGYECLELLHRSARDLADLPGEFFDTVIVNSVVQYFPDVGYLVEVIRAASRLVAPGGRIFIGDVRNARTLKLFHSAVQLARASSNVRVSTLRKRIERALSEEKELAIDPLLFENIGSYVQDVTSVRIELKEHSAVNEMARHRYDVWLEIGGRMDVQPSCREVDLGGSAAMRDDLEKTLRECQLAGAHFTGMRNERLSREALAARLIECAPDELTAGEVRRQVAAFVPSANHVDPGLFYECGRKAGYDAQVVWSDESPDSFEAVVAPNCQRSSAMHRRNVSTVHQAVVELANKPLQHLIRQRLVVQLRKYVVDHLPEYMVPAAFVVLNELPRTPNGKVNRAALPRGELRPDQVGEYVAPSTATERFLAELWAELLRVDRVGMRDNFFELGGHSLLAVTMLARLSERVHKQVPVSAIFRHATIEQLSSEVDQFASAPGDNRNNNDMELQEGIV